MELPGFAMISKDDQRFVFNWAKENQAYLDAEVDLLRLMLQRKALWLRHQWKEDPLQSYQGMVISDFQADRLLANNNNLQAEDQFYRDDPEGTALTKSIANMKTDLDERAIALKAEGIVPAINMMASLFGLNYFEKNVLLLCLAPEIDPSFRRIYAYVQDDVNLANPTPHLALDLFGDKKDMAGWESFLPEAPLRRFRLVNLGTSSPAGSMSPLIMDERITGYLRGINLIDRRIAEMIRPLQPSHLSSSHQDLIERMVRILKSGAYSLLPAINLIGPKGVGKGTFAQALCERLGFRLCSLDLKRLSSLGPEKMDLFSLLEREAVLSQLALDLDLSGLDLDDKQLINSAKEIIEKLGVFLVVSSPKRWQAERDLLTVQVPKPNSEEQSILWRQALEDQGIYKDIGVESLVQQFDLGPQAIEKAVLEARKIAMMRSSGKEKVLPSDLWQACREQASFQMEELAQHIRSPYTWDDIVLSEDVFRQLQEIASQVEQRAQVYERWGFRKLLSHGRGISALFSGASGTGKTMAAEILANHLNLDLYRIDLAGVVSKYIGETEKNLKKVFDSAEESGAILFFDEADALFGKRTEVKDSHDRYANIEVNYLLQRMEDYRGLAILATNRKSALDKAFLRRLRFLVDFQFPGPESRRQIWQKVFPPEAEVNDLDCDALARMEVSGGNIRNIALNAAFLAAGEGKAIGMDQVMHAARREYAKIDKMVSESEFGAYYRGKR
jgi:AAA+ superfamily predicted ATPase